mmetsp:Transcript_89580/g.178086  ORF Transcript_89580/g.178086 Transcript_89580/m.178086 type:complete len:144 (-) Transcript_89580:162-593(-)
MVQRLNSNELPPEVTDRGSDHFQPCVVHGYAGMELVADAPRLCHGDTAVVMVVSGQHGGIAAVMGGQGHCGCCHFRAMHAPARIVLEAHQRILQHALHQDLGWRVAVRNWDEMGKPQRRHIEPLAFASSNFACAHAYASRPCL